MRATFDYSPALRSELRIMRHRCAVVCSIPDSDLQTPIRELAGRNWGIWKAPISLRRK